MGQRSSVVMKAILLTFVLFAWLFPPVAAEYMLEEPNMDYTGNTYTSMKVTTKEECRDACRADSKCYVATFRDDTSNPPPMCWMKWLPVSDPSYTILYPAGSATVTVQSYVVYGTIIVSSYPEGATIFLDGKYVGRSECSLGAPRGRHTINFILEGYQDEYREVTVPKGPGSTRVNATLTPLGSIAVSSSPNGATVFLDGMLKGTTPLIISNLSAGSHTVKFTIDGYQDYSSSVTVIVGMTTRMDAVLTPLQSTGSISVASSPKGATVFLDGSLKGTTPLMIPWISTGNHTVNITMNGFQDDSREVTVIDGQQVFITTYLHPQITTSPNSVTTPGFGAIGAGVVLLLCILFQRKRM